MDDAANARAVEELYEQISDDYLELFTMVSLAYILSCQDIWNEEAAAEYAWCTNSSSWWTTPSWRWFGTF